VTIRAVVKHPGCASRMLSIDPSLESLQGLVAGDIERQVLDEDIGFYCNETGRLSGLMPNFIHPRLGVIVGPVVVTTVDEDGEETSLTEAEARKWAHWLDENTV
jgi:hypothetical protein